VLQYFPPPEDPALLRTLNEVLKRIITGSEVAKNINKNNAQHAIVFEAIALALALEADPDLLTAGAYPTTLRFNSLENSIKPHELAVKLPQTSSRRKRAPLL
jgi:AP-2 complex subunit alpha